MLGMVDTDTVREYFATRTIIDPETGCVIFTKKPTSTGYGNAKISGRQYRAHKLMYETVVGPVPTGLVLHHECRNKICVNPEHLRPVTDWENTMADDTPARRNRDKTHCARGHLLAGDNLHLQRRHDGTTRPKRRCRACGLLSYHRNKGVSV